MDLFSAFCNICYKTDDASLNNISEDNMKTLKDTLVAFVGHTDIINHNITYLCQLCCEDLARSNKFRKMCLSNLIQLRQRVIDMEFKLELEDATPAVQNTLQRFVQEELQRNAFEKRNYPVTNSTGEYNEFQVAFTNEVFEIKNEKLTDSEGRTLMKFGKGSHANFDVCDINNTTERDTLEIEFTKVEFDVKNEKEISPSENFALTNFESESSGHVNLDVEVPAVNNTEDIVNFGIEELHVKQENIITDDLESETIEDKFGDDLNVFEIFTNEENPKGDTKLQNRSCSNQSTSATMNTQPNCLHQPEHRYSKCPTIPQSAIYPATEPSRLYRCTPCNKTFTTLSYLADHESTHSVDRPYKCSDCDKTFKRLSHLIIHERTHSGDRPYKCNVCSKAFTHSSHLIVHKRTHRSDRPYKCTVCHKTFKASTQLTVHERIHSGDRPYQCTICNKAFTQSYSLASHERIHSGERPYKCSICNITFIRVDHLNLHKRTHSGDRPHKCTFCNRGFISSSSLIVHERTHTGVRPYKCTFCYKTFPSSSSLTRHVRTHTGDRPYTCTICNKTFVQSYSLASHKRRHSGDRPYLCTVCNKAFTTSSERSAHGRIHRGDKPYTCTVCNKTFTDLSALTKHKLEHSK